MVGADGIGSFRPPISEVGTSMVGDTMEMGVGTGFATGLVAGESMGALCSVGDAVGGVALIGDPAVTGGIGCINSVGGGGTEAAGRATGRGTGRISSIGASVGTAAIGRVTEGLSGTGGVTGGLSGTGA
jgi:hypothetical protein